MVADSQGRRLRRARAKTMDAEQGALRDANTTRARSPTSCDGADIFLGLSAAGVLKPEMVETMADRPLILALANPEPEIRPKRRRRCGRTAIIATGRSDYPNQVNNVLCFPFIFRGALDVGATTINEPMKLACVRAIAELAHVETSDDRRGRVRGPEPALRARVPDSEAVRSAADHADRAGGREGRDGLGRRDAADRRPRRLSPARSRVRVPLRHRHAAGVRGGEARARSASSTPRARRSACCAPRRSSSTRASLGRS